MTVGDYLPGGLGELVAGAGRTETRATCDRCPMSADRVPWGFRPDMRCCTYHPRLVNVLAGRVLRAGGEAADRVRARMDDDEGVSPWGIEAQAARVAAYASAPETYGHDPAQRCPYLAGDGGGCSVWQSRPGVCRTWFCRHDHGLAGAERWQAVADVLSDVEGALGDLLVDLGDPAAWSSLADWYRWCADRAETLTAGDVAPVVEAARDSLRALAATRLPEAPLGIHRGRPAITAVHDFGDRVGLCGYSPYDVVVASREVFALLSRLHDDADLARTAAEVGIEPAIVDELVRVGAIEPVE